jgi:hypothetical protein
LGEINTGTKDLGEENKIKIENLIWKNIDKKIINENYKLSKKEYLKDKKILGKKKRGRKKNISKIKYNEYIKMNISKYIRENILTQTMRYKFGEKELHIMVAKAYTFREDNIKQQIENSNLNLNDVIKTINNEFFNFNIISN